MGYGPFPILILGQYYLFIFPFVKYFICFRELNLPFQKPELAAQTAPLSSPSENSLANSFLC